MEGMSVDVASGESRVAARGFLPRLAVEAGVARGLPRGVAELAGMKVRSCCCCCWKEETGEAMDGLCCVADERSELTDLPSLDKIDHRPLHNKLSVVVLENTTRRDGSQFI